MENEFKTGLKNRREVYAYLLNRYMAGGINSICYYLMHASSDGLGITVFPELMAEKPAGCDVSDFWWETTEKGRLKRMEVIRKAIKSIDEQLASADAI